MSILSRVSGTFDFGITEDQKPMRNQKVWKDITFPVKSATVMNTSYQAAFRVYLFASETDREPVYQALMLAPPRHLLHSGQGRATAPMRTMDLMALRQRATTSAMRAKTTGRNA